MVEDWMTLSTIVRYRVYCVILRRPSSPSFCSFSRYGNTTVINCRMIDAVMYGMMPSAKIVKRRRLPPLNRSKMPRTEPCPCWKSDSSTLVLMPGVGMCAPMRYTASSARVNNTRFRKSGMRKRFRNASMNRFIPYPGPASLPLRYHLKRAAGFGDLILSGRAERVRVDRELRGQLAVAENLDPVVAAPHESVGAQQLRRHCLSRRKNVQFRQVQNRIIDSERIVKAALGHAAMQRHLPAFKPTAPGITAPRFLPFVAGTGSLPQLRADSPAHAHLAMARAPGRTQVR